MSRSSLQQLRKTASSAALMLVVAWAAAGGVLWQAARILHYHCVRAEDHGGCASDTILLTAASKAVWIEEDELRFEGRMFDVRSRKKAGGDWQLIGHYDAADDEIFELLHALFGLGSQHGERGGRICIFLPEAVLSGPAPAFPVGVYWPQPLYNSPPEKCWHNACPARPDIPPEV